MKRRNRRRSQIATPPLYTTRVRRAQLSGALSVRRCQGWKHVSNWRRAGHWIEKARWYALHVTGILGTVSSFEASSAQSVADRTGPRGAAGAGSVGPATQLFWPLAGPRPRSSCPCLPRPHRRGRIEAPTDSSSAAVMLSSTRTVCRLRNRSASEFPGPCSPARPVSDAPASDRGIVGFFPTFPLTRSAGICPA